jgi:hypothetical protein
MTNRLALAALIAALALPAAAQQAAAPKDLQDAQNQLKAVLAQAKQERADKAAAQKAKASLQRAAELSCHNKKRTAEGLLGTLNLDTMSLETSRAPASKAITETEESKVVDGRCGRLAASLGDSLTFEVTPIHYWGQDFLQLPKSAASADGKPFEAQLHTCQYDGDWHADSDDTLVCTLKAR